VIHTVVENQLALEDQAIVRETLARMISEGLARHEAIHAIGSVLIGYFHERLNEKQPRPKTMRRTMRRWKIFAQKWRDEGLRTAI
jgi:hypothetical protein